MRSREKSLLQWRGTHTIRRWVCVVCEVGVKFGGIGVSAFDNFIVTSAHLHLCSGQAC